MPARRSGCSATKSTIQRLWARMPARRCSYSSGVGGCANSTKLGKNGGTVLGKMTSPTTPSASWSALRRSVSQLRMRRSVSFRSLNGFLYLLAPGVEVVAVLRVEVLAVLRVAAAGVRVGGDDDVAVVVRSCHGPDRTPAPAGTIWSSGWIGRFSHRTTTFAGRDDHRGTHEQRHSRAGRVPGRGAGLPGRERAAQARRQPVGPELPHDGGGRARGLRARPDVAAHAVRPPPRRADLPDRARRPRRRSRGSNRSTARRRRTTTSARGSSRPRSRCSARR